MTATGETAAVTGDVEAGADGRAGDEGPPILYPAAILALWMLSGLGFAGAAVAAVVGAWTVAAVLALGLCLLPGLACSGLILYDAHRSRGTVAGSGFRFDPLLTAVSLVAVYPFGGLAYPIPRVTGPYLAAIGRDPDEMDLARELEFGIENLLNPTEGGVPAWWPGALVGLLWLIVLLGDAVLVGGLLAGTPLAGFVVAVTMRAVATPALWLDAYVMGTTGAFGRGEAVALAAVTTLLYPVAAVAYLPYRIVAAYG